MGARIVFQIPAHTEVRRCTKCPQPIAFVRVRRMWMPVNVEPANVDRDTYRPADDALRFMGWTRTVAEGESHFATCPKAAEFRR